MSTSITRIKKYRGDEKLSRGIAEMETLGWRVQSQTSRTMWYSGFFKNRKLHRVTFTRGHPPDRERATEPAE
jgi:hypothetical protein